jgi:hypothetical protein
LKSKLRSPDFETFISDYDIICLSETKLSNIDEINIDQYVIKCVNRSVCKSNSGGIAILVRQTMCKYVEVLESSSQNVLWFKIEENFLGENCIFGAVYIPPEGSKYSSISIFDDIENNIIELADHESKICLLGDFNSRSGKLNDFANFDHHISDALNFEISQKNILCKNSLEELGYTTDRYSSDTTKVNNYGHRLIQLCKTFNIHIVNGRIGNDSYVGKTTCKSASLVDYVIASPELFPRFKKFDVLDFDPMLSDCHNPIYLAIVCKQMNSYVPDTVVNENVDVTVITKPIWNKDKTDIFIQNIDIDKINAMVLQMEDLNITQNTVDDLCSNICSVMINAASKSGLIKDSKHRNRSLPCKQNKPWFNSDCWKMRKEYHRAKNFHRRNKSVDSFNKLRSSSKNYKKEINKQFRKYKEIFASKLRNLKNTQPKDYWSLLNRFAGGKKDIINKISTEAYFDHFKKLMHNMDSVNNSNVDIQNMNINSNNIWLNEPISVDEVEDAIRKLKNNKSCGSDMILNEFIKNSCLQLITVYVKLFNVVLDTGVIPSSWTEGIIIPIFKNKGEITDPDNYRGITLLSCLGKLFTSILNVRINSFIENMNILKEDQAGFRKGYSTSDHVFSLKCLIDLYLHNKKRLYCAFIDYRKAFDSIDRTALWQKNLRCGVDGKIFRVIHNMYRYAKSCIRNGNELSESFLCNIGVRQGENLSPVLFSLFLNDLTDFLSRAYNGATFASNLVRDCNNELNTYVKLYLLLYADDTIIMAESVTELQAGLNALYLYSLTWKIEVNSNKTKVMVFSRGKIKNLPILTYNGDQLLVVDDFNYLGIKFSYNGKFTKNQKMLVDSARKAMFAILRKSKKLFLPLDIQCHMFDTMVVPILLYGSEVWGYENLNIIESLHLKFCKILLNVKNTTSNCCVYGELGREPLDLSAHTRMICFWSRIITAKQSKLTKILYNVVFKLDRDVSCTFTSTWINCVKDILIKCDLESVWENQITFDISRINWLKSTVNVKLKELFHEKWSFDVYNSSKCLNYRIFKENFIFENYLIQLPANLRQYLTKLRCASHKLPIEKGRFLNITRDERICNLCLLDEIGDEFHYLFKCTHFNNHRMKYIENQFSINPNSVKYNQLMSSSNRHQLIKLAIFCKIILSTFN